MAHHHESSLSVRTQAWHGLAKVLEFAPTIEEAPALCGLDFDVEKLPICPGGEPGVVIEGFHAIRRKDRLITDSRAILGVVTSDYTPIQNRAMFEWMRPLVESGRIAIETAGSLKGGRVVWVMAKILTDTGHEVLPGDSLIPYLFFSMGHDGKLRCSVRMTPIRVVCWNTASAALEGRNVIADIRHVGTQAQIEAQLQSAQHAVEGAIAQFMEQISVFRKMSLVPITVDKVAEIAREVLDPDYIRATKHLKRLKEKAVELSKQMREHLDLNTQIDEMQAAINGLGTGEGVDRVVDAFLKSPGSDMAGRTAWGAFNGFTWTIDRTKNGQITEARMASSWFGAGAQQRQKAFELLNA